MRAQTAEPTHYGHNLVQLFRLEHVEVSEKLERPLVQLVCISLTNLGDDQFIDRALVGALNQVLKRVLKLLYFGME